MMKAPRVALAQTHPDAFELVRNRCSSGRAAGIRRSERPSKTRANMNEKAPVRKLIKVPIANFLIVDNILRQDPQDIDILMGVPQESL